MFRTRQALERAAETKDKELKTTKFSDALAHLKKKNKVLWRQKVMAGVKQDGTRRTSGDR